MEVGAHRNVNSNKCESSHKHLIKKPARNAQRRVVSLDRSIANRQVDRLIIDHAYSALNHQKNRAESTQAETNTGKHLSTRGILTIEKTGDFSLGGWKYIIEHKWDDPRYNKNGMRFYDQTKAFTSVVRHVSKDVGTRWSGDNKVLWRTVTEAKTTKGLLLRCHPDYRSCGPWYDWIVLEDNSIAKLVAIVDPSGYNYDWDDEPRPKYAVIKPRHKSRKRMDRRTLSSSMIDHENALLVDPEYIQVES